MYKLISVFSLLIRQFCLPNPFECCGEYALLINWIVGIILSPIAYLIVGTVYEKGSAPVIGSVLYFITYAALTGILLIMGIYSFAWWWILILILTFIGLIIGIRMIIRRFDNKRYIN